MNWSELNWIRDVRAIPALATLLFSLSDGELVIHKNRAKQVENVFYEARVYNTLVCFAAVEWAEQNDNYKKKQ